PMTKDHWNDIERVYLEVIDLPEDARQAYLHQCSEHDDVRLEVESLLAHHDNGKKLNSSVIGRAAAEVFGLTDNIIGETIGAKYIIRQRLGSGGMGEVYLADHVILNIPFALKRPKPRLREAADYSDYRRRLIEEARRAVSLRDDHITRVHDVIE